MANFPHGKTHGYDCSRTHSVGGGSLIYKDAVYCICHFLLIIILLENRNIHFYYSIATIKRNYLFNYTVFHAKPFTK